VEKLKEIDYERWQHLMKGELDVDFGAFAETVPGGDRGSSPR
jgi:hypothetical protein